MHVAARPTRVDGAPLPPVARQLLEPPRAMSATRMASNMNGCSLHMHFSMRPIGYKHISSAQQTHRAPKLQQQGVCNSGVC